MPISRAIDAIRRAESTARPRLDHHQHHVDPARGGPAQVLHPGLHIHYERLAAPEHQFADGDPRNALSGQAQPAPPP